MKSIVAKEHNLPLYLTIHLCVSRIINNICLTPLLLSPSVLYTTTKTRSSMLTCYVCSENAKQEWEKRRGSLRMDFAQVSLFIIRVRWRVKVNLHSLGVCQLLCCQHTIFWMCVWESVYHRNKKLLQILNWEAEGSFVYTVKIRADLFWIVINVTKAFK